MSEIEGTLIFVSAIEVIHNFVSEIEGSHNFVGEIEGTHNFGPHSRAKPHDRGKFLDSR